MPTVMSQFPVKFDKHVQWAQFDGECQCCEKTLPRNLVRGKVSRPTGTVAVVEAVGICHTCKTVTRFDYRLHDDMRVTGQREDGWQTWKAAPSLWKRLVSILKKPLS